MCFHSERNHHREDEGLRVEERRKKKELIVTWATVNDRKVRVVAGSAGMRNFAWFYNFHNQSSHINLIGI